MLNAFFGHLIDLNHYTLKVTLYYKCKNRINDISESVYLLMDSNINFNDIFSSLNFILPWLHIVLFKNLWNNLMWAIKSLLKIEITIYTNVITNI